MSNNFKMAMGSSDENEFTIKNIAGCRIVFGSVPASDFAMLMHGFSKKAVMATDISSRIGATFVIGEPEDIGNLRKMDLPVSNERNQEYLHAIVNAVGDGNDHSVAVWLREGDRGASSEAMCKRIFSVPQDADDSHPFDPDDLSRCLKFLDETNSHDRVHLMHDVSPQWSNLVDIWDEISSTFNLEKSSGKCPKTYELMQKAIK